jgi:hypothetical protein
VTLRDPHNPGALEEVGTDKTGDFQVAVAKQAHPNFGLRGRIQDRRFRKWPASEALQRRAPDYFF